MDRWDQVKIKVRLRSQVLCSGTLSDRSDHGEWRRADPSDHHLLETPGRLGGWRPPDRTGLILHTAPLNLPVVHANSVMPQAKQSLWMSSLIAENSSIWPVSGCCFLHHIILGWVCSLKTTSSVRSSSSRCWRSIKAVSHPGQGSRYTEVLAHARHLDGLPQCSTSASAIARSPPGLDHARQQGCSPCRRRSWRRRRRSLEGPPCPWRPEVPAVSWVAVTESKWS